MMTTADFLKQIGLPPQTVDFLVCIEQDRYGSYSKIKDVINPDYHPKLNVPTLDDLRGMAHSGLIHLLKDGERVQMTKVGRKIMDTGSLIGLREKLTPR